MFMDRDDILNLYVVASLRCLTQHSRPHPQVRGTYLKNRRSELSADGVCRPSTRHLLGRRLLSVVPPSLILRIPEEMKA
jgi:hypothetical protein